MPDKERHVSKIIITAQVEDSSNWEKGFRTHGELFSGYTATAIHFTVTDENEVAILWEVTDVNTFLEHLDAPGTAEAMAVDGVKQDTVKVFVLDKDINL
jgi:hypothetical protein